MINDLKSDPDFQYLDEFDLAPIPEDMDLPIQFAVRASLSSANTSLIINAVLKMCNRDDLMISRSGVDNVKRRILEKAVKKRKVEDQQFIKLDFDGKVSETNIGKNQLTKKDNISVVCGTSGRYVEHFVPSGRGTGRNIANGVTNVIAETNSLESLRGIGCGKSFEIYI